MVGSVREGIGGIREAVKIVTVATKNTWGFIYLCVHTCRIQLALARTVGA